MNVTMGNDFRELGLLKHQSPSFDLVGRVQRNAERYVWHRFRCRSCGKDDTFWYHTAYRAPRKICLKFSPLAFSETPTRQWGHLPRAGNLFVGFYNTQNIL